MDAFFTLMNSVYIDSINQHSPTPPIFLLDHCFVSLSDLCTESTAQTGVHNPSNLI